MPRTCISDSDKNQYDPCSKNSGDAGSLYLVKSLYHDAGKQDPRRDLIADEHDWMDRSGKACDRCSGHIQRQV